MKKEYLELIGIGFTHEEAMLTAKKTNQNRSTEIIVVNSFVPPKPKQSLQESITRNTTAAHDNPADFLSDIQLEKNRKLSLTAVHNLNFFPGSGSIRFEDWVRTFEFG